MKAGDKAAMRVLPPLSPAIRSDPMMAVACLFLVAGTGSTVGTATLCVVLYGGMAAQAAGPDLGFIAIAAPFALAVGFVGALAGTVFFGLPAMLVLRRARLECGVTYAAAGGCGGLLASLWMGEGKAFEPLLVLPYGIATALAFWRIFRAPALRSIAGG
jgi:hypothetical protein